MNKASDLQPEPTILDEADRKHADEMLRDVVMKVQKWMKKAGEFLAGDKYSLPSPTRLLFEKNSIVLLIVNYVFNFYAFFIFFYLKHKP